MSYLMVHLSTAYKLLERRPDIEDKAAFLTGTVAPDAIMFRPGRQRSDKSLTHFCVGNSKWGHFENYEEWTRSLFDNMRKFSGKVNRDFLLGYALHVVTDIENARLFWTDIRKTNDPEKISALFRDCAEADSILLSEIENTEEMWRLLDNAGKHHLPGLFEAEDISVMVDNMKNEMYFNRYSDLSYFPSFFTISDAKGFINDIADRPLTL